MTRLKFLLFYDIFQVAEEWLTTFIRKNISVYQMPRNIYVMLQMVYSYLKHQKQGHIYHFFQKVNRNLDS